ncbi:DUF2608 domain-containing protein [Vibrio sp. S11_S32]|uniref:DUF2608 domain-containing protein n=1 Tax=Vibrio sp. S11_S32 TaxID=2720225 RepID=UPI0016811FCD|nr:DUF2608 domain-containing protein [Vibrio sp. S11_S32]MBD1577488.1 DUF2608 domain-containing protein [Vibrio sp. S11_S32]
MKSFVFTASVLAVAIASFSASAKVTTVETASYNKVANVIQQLDKQYQTKNVLVAFDIDNTLLTSSRDLGGDIWYAWQTGKLPIKATKEQQVSCLYQDTIPMLYQLLPMKLTEPKAQQVVQDLNQNGQTVIAISARGPENRAATERELHSHKLDFSQHSLAPIGQTQAPIYVEKLDRPTTYMNGVALTTGMHKGKYLEHLLNKTQRHFDSIVFVDDGQANIDALKETFSQAKYDNVDMHLIHYTKVVDDRIAKNGAILTQVQADEMATDWQDLQTTLNAIYPDRAKGCLSR